MLKESFDWTPPGLKEVPKVNLLKLVAKTEATTYHPADPDYPVRKFNAEELKLAARTLIGRPVGRNHEAMPISGAYVLDAEYSDNQVEAVAYVPGEWVDKVRKGLIGKCSIEYTWRDEKRNGGVEFEGLVFTRLDLLEGAKPGDKKATVTLFEADGDSKTGLLLTEVKAVEQEPPAVDPNAPPVDPDAPPVVPDAPVPLTPEEIKLILEHYSITPEEYAAAPEKYPLPEKIVVAPAEAKKLGEPFAGYANLDACVAANQDQADPAAYCAAMQADAEPAVAELKESLVRVVNELATIKTTQDERIKTAKEFAHGELKSAVESVLPKGTFMRDQRTNRLIREIKGVLNEPINSS